MNKLLKISEVAAVLFLPAALIVCTVVKFENPVLIIIASAVLSVIPFFLKFEKSSPRPRDILPVVVLSAIGAVGRIIFAPIPNFKPTAAIVIIAGICLGEESGFLTGALAALASNIFFGQGVWTPFQMYAFGIIGFFAGLLAKTGIFKRDIILYIYGFISPLFYGLIVDSWIVFDTVVPLNIRGAMAIFASGLPFTLVHALSTVIFLIPIHKLWTRNIKRIIKKYDII